MPPGRRLRRRRPPLHHHQHHRAAHHHHRAPHHHHRPRATLPRTTSTSTTPGETSTTGTTYAWTTFEVPEADLCVVEHRSGETLNVRSGPGTAYDVVGSLSFDQTGVHATGVGANDGDGRVWKEIDYFGGHGVGGFVAADPESLRPGRAGRLLRDRHLVPGAPQRPLRPRRRLPEAGEPPLRHGGRPGHRGLLRPTPTAVPGVQIRFRGEVGWAASWLLTAAPCSPSAGSPCALPSGGPSAGCVNGWTTPLPGSAPWTDALEQIGVGGPWSEIDPNGFVVEQMRYCVGPEDADIIDPRPDVERWYIVGYAETDPSFRGRWLVRRTGVGFGLVAVAPYTSTGFGSGVWETCPDGCRIGRPLAGELVRRGLRRGLPGGGPAWASPPAPGPRATARGLPPEVLGLLRVSARGGVRGPAPPGSACPQRPAAPTSWRRPSAGSQRGAQPSTSRGPGDVEAEVGRPAPRSRAPR